VSTPEINIVTDLSRQPYSHGFSNGFPHGFSPGRTRQSAALYGVFNALWADSPVRPSGRLSSRQEPEQGSVHWPDSPFRSCRTHSLSCDGLAIPQVPDSQSSHGRLAGPPRSRLFFPVFLSPCCFTVFFPAGCRKPSGAAACSAADIVDGFSEPRCAGI
jgi:hypothetical protein